MVLIQIPEVFLMEVIIIMVVHLEVQDLMVILVQLAMVQAVVRHVQGGENGEAMMVGFMIVVCAMVVELVMGATGEELFVEIILTKCLTHCDAL